MNEQDVRTLNELINGVMDSWALQAVIACLFVGLVVVAFTRASRTFADDRTRRAFRIAVVALGVLAVLQAVVTAALGRVPYLPVLLIEFVWLFALWLYYFIRFMTRQRSGRGDPETQRRGAALDGTISRMEQERRGGGDAAVGGGPVAPR